MQPMNSAVHRQQIDKKINRKRLVLKNIIIYKPKSFYSNEPLSFLYTNVFKKCYLTTFKNNST